MNRKWAKKRKKGAPVKLETVEQYLARGGQIKRIPPKQRALPMGVYSPVTGKPYSLDSRAPHPDQRLAQAAVNPGGLLSQLQRAAPVRSP